MTKSFTRNEIRAIAQETIRKHGMHVVSELNHRDNYSGANVVALMEIFAEKLKCESFDEVPESSEPE